MEPICGSLACNHHLQLNILPLVLWNESFKEPPVYYLFNCKIKFIKHISQNDSAWYFGQEPNTRFEHGCPPWQAGNLFTKSYSEERMTEFQWDSLERWTIMFPFGTKYGSQLTILFKNGSMILYVHQYGSLWIKIHNKFFFSGYS